jgi:hypothetical protein
MKRMAASLLVDFASETGSPIAHFTRFPDAKTSLHYNVLGDIILFYDCPL